MSAELLAVAIQNVRRKRNGEHLSAIYADELYADGKDRIEAYKNDCIRVARFGFFPLESLKDELVAACVLAAVALGNCRPHDEMQHAEAVSILRAAISRATT